MDWTNEVIIEFIQLFESHPVLWDPKHKNHKNRNTLFDAWQTIANDISIDVKIDQLRKKKESLMATYRTLAKKVRDSCTTGSGAKDVFVPSWFPYEAIDRFICAKTKKMPSLSSEKPTNKGLSDEHEVTFNEEDVPVQDNLECELTQDNSSGEKQTTKRVGPKKRGQVCLTEVDKHLKQASEVLTSLVAGKSQTRPLQDGPALYGDLLATKLRKLSTRRQLILQNQIDNMIFEAEIDELDSLNSSMLPSPKSPILTSYETSLPFCNHTTSIPSPTSSISSHSAADQLTYYYVTAPNKLGLKESNNTNSSQ